MPRQNTQNIINHLSQAFGDAIEKAWKGDAADTIIDPSATHEANHVARFVYGVPGPMVAAIKQVDGVKSVAVEGMFCHTSPYAFWDRMGALDEVECRELADLMVEVEIISDQGSASRAVLVQTKMKEDVNWKAPLTVSASALAKEQRQLYTYLPPFCLEVGSRPTAQTVRNQKLTVATHPGLAIYNLGGTGGLLNRNPGGLVYAAINKSASRLGQKSPWLLEDGRPPLPANTPSLAISDGVFSLDFAEALASMVVENRVGRVPPIGVRSDGCLGVPVGWKSLIEDLKDFARQRLREIRWKQASNTAKKKALGVVVIPSVGKSESKALLNRATFAIADGQVMALTKCVRTPRWLPEPAWWDSFDTNMGGGWLAGAGMGHTPEYLRKLELRVPEGGFGFLKIRIEVTGHLE